MSMSEAQPSATQEAVRSLIAAKLKLLVPMTIIFMTGYIGLTVLAGFAQGFMAIKVYGALNLGYTLIAVNYLISWVLALVYERVANDRFDPLASKAAAQAVTRRQAS
jgi:uncharacterized membrane protein (DUF485 family)